MPNVRRQLRQPVDAVMGRRHEPLSGMIDAHSLRRFFDDEVAGARSSTADAAPTTCTAAPPDCSMWTFTTDDVIAAVRRLPDKQCAQRPCNMISPYLWFIFL